MATKLVNIMEKHLGSTDLLRNEASTETIIAPKPNSFLDRVKKLLNIIRSENQNVEVGFNDAPSWIDFRNDGWSQFNKYE